MLVTRDFQVPLFHKVYDGNIPDVTLFRVLAKELMARHRAVLALLPATLARKVATQAGLDLSLPALLDELSAIREVAALYPQGTLAHRKDPSAPIRAISGQEIVSFRPQITPISRIFADQDVITLGILSAQIRHIRVGK